jgi:hypothetical protein
VVREKFIIIESSESSRSHDRPAAGIVDFYSRSGRRKRSRYPAEREEEKEEGMGYRVYTFEYGGNFRAAISALHRLK